MFIIGIDPGLRRTGWGVISVVGVHLKWVAHGTLTSRAQDPLSDRLRQLYDGLQEVIAKYQPDEAAVEETFVSKNPNSTLKLGQARGIALLVPALAGLPVAEYPPNLVKKAVVGSGHAQKQQVEMMVRVLLPSVVAPGGGALGSDAADALAVAICHAHLRQSDARFATARVTAGARS